MEIDKNSKILITGVAGFIGFHLADFLLQKGFLVIGVDNINSYYDIELKNNRLDILNKYKDFIFLKIDLKDKQLIDDTFKEYLPEYVVNLAAQAGVRYSITNPYDYVDSNLIGFMNILEACRNFPVKHLIYASSSSVYGGNKSIPFSTNNCVDHPVSLYAATKKANELMAHSYSHLYNIPTTGLRFFTVYGPWGRPDMAYFLFTKKILAGETINVFNHGNMERDFTYIDDIVEGIFRVIPLSPNPNPLWNETEHELGSSFAPYKIYNIGNSMPVQLMKFISILENELGINAKIEFSDMQPGEVCSTYADIDDLQEDIDFKPGMKLEEGLHRFIEWYKEYYR